MFDAWGSCVCVLALICARRLVRAPCHPRHTQTNPPHPTPQKRQGERPAAQLAAPPRRLPRPGLQRRGLRHPRHPPPRPAPGRRRRRRALACLVVCLFVFVEPSAFGSFYLHLTLPLQPQQQQPPQKKGSVHGPCRLLDFELEVGAFVGGPPNPLGACNLARCKMSCCFVHHVV